MSLESTWARSIPPDKRSDEYRPDAAVRKPRRVQDHGRWDVAPHLPPIALLVAHEGGLDMVSAADAARGRPVGAPIVKIPQPTAVGEDLWLISERRQQIARGRVEAFVLMAAPVGPPSHRAKVPSLGHRLPMDLVGSAADTRPTPRTRTRTAAHVRVRGLMSPLPPECHVIDVTRGTILAAEHS